MASELDSNNEYRVTWLALRGGLVAVLVAVINPRGSSDFVVVNRRLTVLELPRFTFHFGYGSE
jgi:hypothetical protein